MDFKAEIIIHAPNGMYCECGKSKCNRLQVDKGKKYCELFFPYLDEDIHNRALKCKDCLFAHRKALEVR